MPAHLICASITTEPSEVASSLPSVCSACGAGIWVSIAGRRTLADYPTCQPVCERCGYALAAADPDAHFEIAEGAMDEVEQIVGRAGAMAARSAVEGLNRAMRRRSSKRHRG